MALVLATAAPVRRRTSLAVVAAVLLGHVSEAANGALARTKSTSVPLRR